jgi:hypothetical protein
VVALEVVRPTATQLEIGDSLQMQGQALDQDGNVVPDSGLWWSTPDTTVRVDSLLGWVVPLEPNLTGRVIARAGTLVSNPTTFSFIARADTLILASAEDVTVPSGETGSGPIDVHLESFDPAGPLAGRPIIFEVIEPVFGDPLDRSVELSTGVLLDTVTTTSTGSPSPPVELHLVAGPAPDSAVVEIRSFRARGTTPVPGSGRRVIVRFSP